MLSEVGDTTFFENTEGIDPEKHRVRVHAGFIMTAKRMGVQAKFTSHRTQQGTQITRKA
jgi:ribosomal protein L19